MNGDPIFSREKTLQIITNLQPICGNYISDEFTQRIFKVVVLKYCYDAPHTNLPISMKVW